MNDDLHQWANGFKIWMNGSLIHSSKTFKPMLKKLKLVTDEFDLQIENGEAENRIE